MTRTQARLSSFRDLERPSRPPSSLGESRPDACSTLPKPAPLRSPLPSRWSGYGFSLIELLVVIAILGIVLVLGVPAAGQIMRASGMANAGDQVLTALSLARQNAIARNRTVEVRFYKYTDVSDPQGGRFHAMQSFVLEPGAQGVATNALGRKVTLPSTTYISPAASLSSLLDPSASPRSTGAVLGQSISPCGLDYEAAIFRVYPDGSTSITNTQPVFVTVVPANTPDDTSTTPFNFATIVLQPATGKAQLHRP